jgi:hypothetical protein
LHFKIELLNILFVIFDVFIFVTILQIGQFIILFSKEFNIFDFDLIIPKQSQQMNIPQHSVSKKSSLIS